MFKKGLSLLDTSVLIISFIGVTFLITGSVNNHRPNEQNMGTLIIPIIAMLSIPVLTGTLAMTMRQLRGVNEYTTGCYMAFSMFLLSLPIALLQEKNLSESYHMINIAYNF